MIETTPTPNSGWFPLGFPGTPRNKNVQPMLKPPTPYKFKVEKGISVFPLSVGVACVLRPKVSSVAPGHGGCRAAPGGSAEAPGLGSQGLVETKVPNMPWGAKVWTMALRTGKNESPFFVFFPKAWRRVLPLGSLELFS